MIKRLIALLALCIFASSAWGGEIKVAVASNFSDAIKAIATRFEARTGHKLILVFGATGKHYAQISNGAPFDVFLAADEHRPLLLEQKGVGVPGSRFTYAYGRVVLWSPRDGYVDAAGNVLVNGTFRYLAIANPKLAPYGKAAKEVLEARGLWSGMQKRLVQGGNIGQAFQFVKTGNAELGLIAYSQIKRPGMPISGSRWEIPSSLYSPIKQQAIILKDGDTARAFLEFVKGREARAIIIGYGYDIP